MNRNKVAEIAGVSPSTVTRALNSHSSIPVSTQERIKRITAKLGYVPSHLGRSYYQKKSFRIGVVVPYSFKNMAHPLPDAYFSKLLFGILRCAMREKYTVNLIADDGLDAQELEQSVLAHSVDGLVFFIRETGDIRYEILYRKKIPFILVHNYVPGKQYLYVDCDSRQGMEEAFGYLISKKIKTAGYLTGGNNYINSLDRLRIFRELSEANGIKVTKIIDGDYSFKSGFTAAKVFSLRRLPQVVMCANDKMAFGLIEGFKQFKIKVPQDAGVIGFDNQDNLNLEAFQLTTIENPFFEIGALAASKLIDALNGKKAESAALPSKFVLRASV